MDGKSYNPFGATEQPGSQTADLVETQLPLPSPHLYPTGSFQILPLAWGPLRLFLPSQASLYLDRKLMVNGSYKSRQSPPT